MSPIVALRRRTSFGMIVLAGLTTLIGCSAPATRTWPVTGRIVTLDAASRTVTLAHEPIEGYMPAMTMPFSVADWREAETLVPGDLLQAHLVVGRRSAYLSALRKHGHVTLPDVLTAAPAHDDRGFVLEGDVLPDAAFTSQDGRPRRIGGDGRIHVLTFIYTRCPLPTFCPLMDWNFRQLQQAVAAEATLRGRVRLWSITIDPAHDTPAVLDQHATRLGADPAIWQFVTPAAGANTFAERFGVTTTPDLGDPATLVHGLATVVVGAGGVVTTIVRGNTWQPAQLVDALRAAATEARP